MNATQTITEILIKSGIIPANYTGEVVLHYGCGGLCNVEPRQKQVSLIDRVRGLDFNFTFHNNGDNSSKANNYA